jgi:hypothetical protein
VQEALARLVRETAPGKAPVTLVLPAGAARIVLLDVPSGVAPREYARYRLLPGLPYPSEEAVVDVLGAGNGRALGAAARRGVLAGYEEAAAAAGLVQERVDLAPLAATAALLGEPRPAATEVGVIVGDAAVSLAVVRDGGLRAFHTRLRDPGEDEALRLGAEADRIAAVAGANGGSPRYRILGRGASALRDAWTADGRLVEAAPAAEGGFPADAAELAWLGSALS